MEPPVRIYNVKVERCCAEKLRYTSVPEILNATVVQPESADLRQKLPACYDQGALGSCTANALVAAFQNLRAEFYGSRLFLYYNERLLEGSIPYDAGATLYDGVASLIKHGVCSESDWPYIISKFAVQPPSQCYTNALLNRVITAANVPQNLYSMKASINAGYPFVIGFAVFASFESPQVSATGMVPMPSLSERFLGGHAVLVVGYNDATQRWIVRNSWGTGWGDRGYFYVPYAYFLNPILSSDIWNISSVTVAPTPVTPVPAPAPAPAPPKPAPPKPKPAPPKPKPAPPKPKPAPPKPQPKPQPKPAPKPPPRPQPKPRLIDPKTGVPLRI